MHRISEKTLQKIQRRFHEVIRERCREQVERHKVTLPQLKPQLFAKETKQWFPVPGMCGGFSYWIERDGKQVKLIAESWSRVVAGSGQRHEITETGSKLVKEGFA